IASCGNSMSTTGPVTRAMRPTAPATGAAAAGAVAVSVMFLSLRKGLLGGRQCVSAAHDLGNLLGDLGLARVVRKARVVGDELVGIVARRLHRLLRGCVLGRRGLEHRVVDAALDVDGQEAVEHRVADLLGGVEVGAVGAAHPAALEGAVPELEVAHRLPTDEEVPDVLALAAEELGELLRLAKDLRVEGTGETA